MPFEVHFLGRVDYAPTYAAMQAFTQTRQGINTSISNQTELTSSDRDRPPDCCAEYGFTTRPSTQVG